MTTDDYSPRRLADRAAINDTMLRWCRGVDRRDVDLVRSAFHPDATDSHGQYEGGVDGLVAWLQHRHRTISMSMHLCTNMTIEFVDDDHALVETYCIAAQRYSSATPEGREVLAAMAGGRDRGAGGDTDMLAFARYLDEFERRDGAWLIARRAVVHDKVGMQDVPADAPQPGEGWVVGTRDAADPVLARRSALGLGGRPR